MSALRITFASSGDKKLKLRIVALDKKSGGKTVWCLQEKQKLTQKLKGPGYIILSGNYGNPAMIQFPRHLEYLIRNVVAGENTLVVIINGELGFFPRTGQTRARAWNILIGRLVKHVAL